MSNWDGRPSKPEQHGSVHILMRHGTHAWAVWQNAPARWFLPRFSVNWVTSEQLIKEGWCYLGPALAPAEVEARKRAAELHGFEAALKIIEDTNDMRPRDYVLRIELARRRTEAST